MKLWVGCVGSLVFWECENVLVMFRFLIYASDHCEPSVARELRPSAERSGMPGGSGEGGFRESPPTQHSNNSTPQNKLKLELELTQVTINRDDPLVGCDAGHLILLRELNFGPSLLAH
mgnify:FL=1